MSFRKLTGEVCDCAIEAAARKTVAAVEIFLEKIFHNLSRTTVGDPLPAAERGESFAGVPTPNSLKEV